MLAPRSRSTVATTRRVCIPSATLASAAISIFVSLSPAAIGAIVTVTVGGVPPAGVSIFGSIAPSKPLREIVSGADALAPG